MSFFGKLIRRNVFRTGIAYLAAAWLLLQVADMVLSDFSAPGWIIQALIFSSVLGFPCVLVLAWLYGLTPQGIRALPAIAFSLMLVPSRAWAQQVQEFLSQDLVWLGEGWQGFADIGFLANALLTLTLAAVLGAAIAYHPKHLQTADTLEEIEAPRVYILYAVIGAIIGILVVRYGLVVGFVLFGIGGLIRFRTVLRSATLTGNVIFVTLIGLSCGLDLPHVAVLTTAFVFVLIYILEARVTYRIDVRALPTGRVAEAAAAYRGLLEQHGCRIRNEKKDPGKERVTFIFHGARHVTRHQLEDLLETKIDATLKGSVDWEID